MATPEKQSPQSLDVQFYIMLPTYERPELILRAVQSILIQDYSNYHLYIFNDGSHANYAALEDLIKNNTNITYIKNPENIGINKSRNLMLDLIEKELPTHSDAAYFFTLSDDDYLDNHAFDTMREAISQSPDSNWFCFNCHCNHDEPDVLYEDYSTHQQLNYHDFRRNYRGDKHFLFHAARCIPYRYAKKFFKNGYEHTFYYQIPFPITVIPQAVKTIHYYDDGLSKSDLYKINSPALNAIKHILLCPTEKEYYKWLIIALHPKQLAKKIISENRYYRIKKLLGLKIKHPNYQ